jgi:putative transposase
LFVSPHCPLANSSSRSTASRSTSFKKHQERLLKAQQALSRKEKLSKNGKKAKAKVQPIHARIANARLDLLHKRSAIISKKPAMVVVENLPASYMSRSAAGTVEQPGKNVKQKTGLNRAILDQGWREFRRQLEYKMLWSGGLFIPVPPKRTSITCPRPGCGQVSKENRKTPEQFTCVMCGFSKNAGLVGAIHVLRAGHAQLACQVNCDVSSRQQEPPSIAAYPLCWQFTSFKEGRMSSC